MPAFTRADLTRTSKAASNEIVPARRYGVLIPSAQIERNLQALQDDVLEPVAAACGRGKLDSAYRCPVVNALVGGDPNSAHVVALAADWIPPDFAQAIGWLATCGRPLDRVIYEVRGKVRWLHLQRHQLDRLPHATLWFFSPKGGVYTPTTTTEILGRLP